MDAKMIGSKIAAARKKMGISQAQLAERLFVSPQAVGKWERGESTPDIITLNSLAGILGVDLNYFSEDIKPMTNDTATVEASEKKLPEIPTVKQNKLSWNMSEGNWVDADFSGLKNLQEKFSSSNMRNCKFAGSELSGLLLKSNNVELCDFSDSNISNSDFQNSNLGKNTFKNCILKETKFLKCNIGECDFSGADFTKSVFTSSTFLKNKIENAIWNNTSFIEMGIQDIVFEGTLENCSFESCSFYSVKFQNATTKNTFFKNNKKLKRVQFINCKADKMSYAFLKSNLADLTDVTLTTE